VKSNCEKHTISFMIIRLKSMECLLLFNVESFVFQLLFKNLNSKVYRTIISPVDVYGCESLSLTLREERKLRVFENRVLRSIFGPKRDDVTGERRNLDNEQLSYFY
jgi:hypothetical protein